MYRAVTQQKNPLVKIHREYTKHVYQWDRVHPVQIPTPWLGNKLHLSLVRNSHSFLSLKLQKLSTGRFKWYSLEILTGNVIPGKFDNSVS
jgi:hypothetical protein